MYYTSHRQRQSTTRKECLVLG